MKEIRAWVIAGLAALATGVVLGAVGLGDGATLGVAGIAVFSVTFLFVKNGYGRRKIDVGDSNEKELAIAATTDPVNSVLYLIRDESARIIGVDVSIDGQAIARLKGNHFTRIVLRPGKHTVQTTFTQGALGSVPVVSRPIELLVGEPQAIFISPPVDQKQDGVALLTQVADETLRHRLRTMAFVKPDIDNLR